MKWYDKLKPVLNDPNYLRRKLIDEKSYVSLKIISSGIGWMSTEEERKNRELIREKTLSYLLTLLKEKKIKMAGWYVLPEYDGKEGWREFTGTPEEIIETIRKEWNEAARIAKEKDNPDILLMYEEEGVWITLPENEWVYYDETGGPYLWKDYEKREKEKRKRGEPTLLERFNKIRKKLGLPPLE